MLHPIRLVEYRRVLKRRSGRLQIVQDVETLSKVGRLTVQRRQQDLIVVLISFEQDILVYGQISRRLDGNESFSLRLRNLIHNALREARILDLLKLVLVDL